MLQNNPAQKNIMRVQKYAFLAVKTEKTAKNRPRGHFQNKRNSYRWLIKGATPISYPKQSDGFNIWV